MGQAPGAEEGDVGQQPLNRLGAGMRNALPSESLRIVRTRISETFMRQDGERYWFLRDPCGAFMRQGVPSAESRCFHAPASLRLSEHSSALAGAAGSRRSTLPIQYLRFSLELNRYEIQI